ncbi:hypothetical protein ACHAWU_001037 [Discostella pseudostelligera]|uniref:Uncharacterized protein n=1 Tax=Discostella pseudostelligera TaxID=259834 RepID=A0ABD3MFJ8_9STRA
MSYLLSTRLGEITRECLATPCIRCDGHCLIFEHARHYNCRRFGPAEVFSTTASDLPSTKN